MFLLQKIKAVCWSGVGFLHEGEEQAGYHFNGAPRVLCLQNAARALCCAAHGHDNGNKKSKTFLCPNKCLILWLSKLLHLGAKTSGAHRFQIEIFTAAAFFFPLLREFKFHFPLGRNFPAASTRTWPKCVRFIPVPNAIAAEINLAAATPRWKFF